MFARKNLLNRKREVFARRFRISDKEAAFKIHPERSFSFDSRYGTMEPSKKIIKMFEISCETFTIKMLTLGDQAVS